MVPSWQLLLFLTFSLIPLVLSPPWSNPQFDYDDDYVKKQSIRNCPVLQKDIVYCEKRWEQCPNTDLNCYDSYCECVKKSKATKKDCEEAKREVCKNNKTFIDTERSLVENLAEQFEPVGQALMLNFTINCVKDFERKVDAVMERLDEKSSQKSQYVRLFLAPWEVISNNHWNVTGNLTEWKYLGSCNSSLNKLEAALRKMDGRTMESLKIPYQQWWCGWQQGDFGRIITRAEALILAKESLAEQMNHCCVAQLSCYAQKRKKNECDVEYAKCLPVPTTGKASIRVYRTVAEYRQMLSDEISYERATSMATRYFPYGDTLGRGFERWSTNESGNVFYLLDMDLESFEDEDRRKESFEFLYRYCRSHEMIVSSCGSIFQNCLHDQKTQETCAAAFGDCLSNINAADGDCSRSIAEMKLAVGLKTLTCLERIMPILSWIFDKVTYWEPIMLLGYILKDFVFWICKLLYKCIKKPTVRLWKWIEEKKWGRREDPIPENRETMELMRQAGTQNE